MCPASTRTATRIARRSSPRTRRSFKDRSPSPRMSVAIDDSCASRVRAPQGVEPGQSTGLTVLLQREGELVLEVAIQAGLRVSELVGLGCGDVALGTGGHVRIEGKGRKQRSVPLTRQTQAVLAVWLAEREGQREDPLFPTRTGRRLSRDAVERRDTTMRVAEGQAASPPRVLALGGKEQPTKARPRLSQLVRSRSVSGVSRGAR
jgi:integrase